MSKVQCYYRLSDNSYNKPKLPGTDKETCFKSFSKAFCGSDCNVTIIADRVKESSFLFDNVQKVICTDLGNAGSLRYAIELAVEECDEDSIVYFAEDDYLYRPDAIDVLREGIEIADYVTLYDHPDKYTNLYDFGEMSKVRKTSRSHWRYTLSTCMTFGVKRSILRHDLYFWKEQTEGLHPNDHQVFCDLNAAHRSLAVCIPGWACHTDLTFSGVVNSVLIEEWAIDQMIDHLDNVVSSVKDESFQNLYRSALDNPVLSKWQHLQLLDALVKMVNKNTKG